MSTYSETDAKADLSRLIVKALRGERVIITRDGKAVVELRPVAIERSHPAIPDEAARTAARPRIENALALLDERGIRPDMTTDELMRLTRGED